jgi:hypothetical protein
MNLTTDIAQQSSVDDGSSDDEDDDTTPASVDALTSQVHRDDDVQPSARRTGSCMRALELSVRFLIVVFVLDVLVFTVWNLVTPYLIHQSAACVRQCDFCESDFFSLLYYACVGEEPIDGRKPDMPEPRRPFTVCHVSLHR